MSETSSLSELARFIGQSGVIASDARANRLAVNDIITHLSRRKPAKPKVSELLGVVLTLSARTRRMVMPKVDIELDVFVPGGNRAVRLTLPQ
ncbi:MAG TPA: hypothetical protein VFE52_06460 [Devosia sp.]|jgi:hypothetical protein|nr:hypothetical protein [Devosia sp.]